MAITASEVSSAITEVQAISDSILKEIESFAPSLEVPAATAGTIVDLFSQLANLAINAWSNASGTPITVESVQALLPNSTPLTAPTESIPVEGGPTQPSSPVPPINQ